MSFKIWCNSPLTASDKQLLQQGLRGHELICSGNKASSVLAPASPDERLLTVDIAFGQPAPQDLLPNPQLKWLQISSAGYTRYDTPEFRAAAKARNLAVSNSSSVFDQPCAEHVLSFMLAQARLLPEALSTVEDHGSSAWARLRGGSRLLSGQKVLILGYGAIGEKLRPMLEGLQMEVTGVRRTPTGKEKVKMAGFDELPSLLPEADHVIDILPEAPGTRHFINRELLALMKPGAVFYNIGRGATVQQEDLAEALSSGKLAAAWLDVTDPEPLPEDHILRKTPRCYITPHTAGGHQGESNHLVRHFLENFQRFVDGKPLQNRIM